MKIYPYNPNSESAKALSKRLDMKRIKHEGAPLTVDWFINWGASHIDRKIKGVAVNRPECVAVASDKLKSFLAFKEKKVPIPEFTQDKEEANKWLEDGKRVVARTKLNAHSGEGIVISDPDNGVPLANAKLYTLYIPKAEEYRLHVMNGSVFFIQRKARNKDIEDDKVNWLVRNHQNGFIYANQDVKMASSDKAAKAAIMAVQALELDFGAVDLVYNRSKDKYYVLEVNTAPGLTGSTLDAYVNAFEELAENQDE